MKKNQIVVFSEIVPERSKNQAVTALLLIFEWNFIKLL